MDFTMRIKSLEQIVKDILDLLHQQAETPPTGSSQFDPILNRLDELSKSVLLLREDCQHAQGQPLNARKENAGSSDSALSIANLGYRFVASLSLYGAEFSGKIRVLGLGPFDLFGMSKRLADYHSFSSLATQHTSTSIVGVSQLFLPWKANFKFPDFSNLPQTAPEGYANFFETIIASPPRKPIAYYVGPPLTPDLNTLLSPGKLLELGELPGMTTPYWHAGERASGTAFHYEDGAVRSANLTIAGFKLWILIDLTATTKFESFIESFNPLIARIPRCSQWVRHLNYLVSPEELVKMDIKFDLILAGPGDMVITAPGQYHAVLNLTSCFAISINFALPEDPTLAPSLVCPDCGLFTFKHPSLRMLDKQEQNPMESGSRRKRPAPAVANEQASPNSLRPSRPTKRQTTLPQANKHHSRQIEDNDMQLQSDRAGSTSSVGSTSIEAENVGIDPGSDAMGQNELESENDRALSKTPPSTSSPSTETFVAELLRLDPQCNIPRFDRITPPYANVFRLTTAIRSRYAVKQFHDLVSAKRDLGLQRIFFPTYVRTDAARRLRVLNGLQNSKVITHLNQYLFAADIEEARSGSLRVASSVKKDVTEASGLTSNQYDYHLRLGKKWREICGRFDGIICFIPSDKNNPFQVSPAKYYEMDSQELRLFHSLLADTYSDSICIAGKAFQQSLVHDAYFEWEARPPSKPFYELAEDDMLHNLRPVLPLSEDRYCAAGIPDWPDPTLLLPTEKQCDYCLSPSCSCYFSKVSKAKPRIMSYPGKGLGLQATSATPGAIVYWRHDLLGFLTGKIVPPHHLHNDYTVEFHNCQLDCRDQSSIFRLVNHACPKHAVAHLRIKRVSGRYRLAVVACKNIHDGAEITFTYNSGKWGYRCEGCDL